MEFGGHTSGGLISNANSDEAINLGYGNKENFFQNLRKRL